MLEHIHNLTMSQDSKFPLNFIQRNDKNHLLLFYDSLDYARKIQCEYLKKGLKNNEVCYFFTKDPENIEMTLKGMEIDFERYITKKQLKIITPSDGKEIFEKILNTNLETPSRIVGDKILFSNENSDFETGCDFEQYLHDLFPDFNGSILCSYHVNSIDDAKRVEIIDFLLLHHHAVMFAPKMSKGTSYYLQ